MPRKLLNLEAVNSRLKQANAGVTVLQRGGRLSLRGTFPPKPGSGRTRPSQQTIALGVKAIPAGFRYAEARAMEVAGLLAQNRFEWETLGTQAKPDTVGVWIERYKARVIAASPYPPEEAELRWHNYQWALALSRLDPALPMGEPALVAAALKTPPKSRARQTCCGILSRFAKEAGVECDLSALAKGYSPSQVRREIPDDDLIVTAIDGMEHPRWQWFAGMMATYGLRNHECWHCTLEQYEGVWFCHVDQHTKTGARDWVPPIPVDWVERWQLWDVRPPQVNARINADYGARSSAWFARKRMPFRPYDLRHAWVHRAELQEGYPELLRAKWLGHSVKMHQSMYQSHLDQATATRLFLARQNRSVDS